MSIMLSLVMPNHRVLICIQHIIFVPSFHLTVLPFRRASSLLISTHCQTSGGAALAPRRVSTRLFPTVSAIT